VQLGNETDLTGTGRERVTTAEGDANERAKHSFEDKCVPECNLGTRSVHGGQEVGRKVQRERGNERKGEVRRAEFLCEKLGPDGFGAIFIRGS